MLNQMTTTFTYQNKQYQVDIDAIDWYNKTNDQIIVKLPDGTLLEVDMWFESNPPQPKLKEIEFKVLEAKEIDQEELAYQSLLKDYSLSDNAKTRKLWDKCKVLENDRTKAVNYFHDLIDLIKED